MEWVQAGYGGNPWLTHLKAATYNGDALSVTTDYKATAANRTLAKNACTAFRAFELFSKKGSTVTVLDASGKQLASC